MRSITVLTVFSLLISLVTIPTCESRAGSLGCVQCRGEDCEIEPPKFCLFKEIRNSCGRRVCLKGPDESCGGPHNIAGICAEGLTCYRNRCEGCYVDDMDKYNCSKNL